MKIKQPFFDPDTGGAAGSGLAESLSAGVMSKITAPTHPFASNDTTFVRVDGKTVAVPTNSVGTTIAPPEPSTPAAAAEQPPATEPQQPVQPQGPPEQSSEGGKYIILRHPDGKFMTRIKNDPDVIAAFIEADKQFIRELRTQTVQPQYVPPPPAPQGPTADELRQRDLQAVRSVAQKHFPRVDSDGREVVLDPITNTLADITASIREELRSEFRSEIEQTRNAYAQDLELASVVADDPTFDIQSDEIRQLRREFPKASPLEIQKERIWRNFQNFRRTHQPAPTQQPSAAAPAAPAPTAPPPAAPQMPTDAWRLPNGSSPSAAQSYEAHPHVVNAVETHKRTASLFGKQVTPESIARIRDIAINDLKNQAAAARGEFS